MEMEKERKIVKLDSVIKGLNRKIQYYKNISEYWEKKYDEVLDSMLNRSKNSEMV